MSLPQETPLSRQLALLRPKLYCRDITVIDFAHLAELGIRYFCIDIDNTLAPRSANRPLPHLAEALKKARKAGYISDMCLVSNIICGEKRRQRVANFAEEMNIANYYAANFWNRKPAATPFTIAMRKMRSLPANTAIIGDQLFTDILGGNSLGLYTILVMPLGPDHWTTRLTRRRQREQKLLAKFGMGAPLT